MENDGDVAQTSCDTTIDEGFYSFDCSFSSTSSDSFVDVTSLSSGSLPKPNFRAVVHSNKLLFDSETPPATLNIPKPILCGISSFQGFKMSTNALKVRTNQDELCESAVGVQVVNCNDSKENIPKKIPCPNILKHNRSIAKKANEPFVSPIKSLSFSPSRFLNTSCGELLNDASTCGVVKELSFDPSSPFDAEDSGIGASYTSEPLTPPSLTSTPVSGRPRRKSFQKNCQWSPSVSDPLEEGSDFPLQSTPKSSKSEENHGNQTPVICKYLNESAPRTPTPFKCPSALEEDAAIEDGSKRYEEGFLSPESDSCFKKPSPVGPNWPARRFRATNKHRTQKTARKALLLDQEPSASKPNLKPAKQLPRYNERLPLMHTNIDVDQSSLVGNKTFVERQVSPRGKKWVFRTRQRKQTDRKPGLDKHWVAVACGHSFDQKVMTEAAKRCLRRNNSPRRKSARSKDKKQKRKEESERTDRYWKLVEEANSVKDLLENFVSFKKFDKNGLNLDVQCFQFADLNPDLVDWAFQLTKSNMQEQYENNWGWNDKDKLKELKEERMRFLFAFDGENKPVAFTSFRFDLDFGEPVVYCYEIQLTAPVQRKGLGKFMIQILHLFAIKHKMQKVVATVLHSNEASKNFFKNTLRYSMDDTSPLDECYEILSKAVPQNNT